MIFIHSLFTFAREPEYKTLSNGTRLCEVWAVSNDRKKKGDNQWEDEPCFISIKAFGNRVNSIERLGLVKGSKVVIHGKLKYRQWQAQDGSRRSQHEIVIDSLEPCWVKPADSGGGGGYSQPRQQQQSNEPPPMEIPEDEIPF